MTLARSSTAETLGFACGSPATYKNRNDPEPNLWPYKNRNDPEPNLWPLGASIQLRGAIYSSLRVLLASLRVYGFFSLPRNK